MWKRAALATMLWLLCSAAIGADATRELDWMELLPPGEMEALGEAPPLDHNGMFKMTQTGSFKVVPSLNGSKIKIAGYIVPVEVSSNSQMSEFFIVPYFGACIHVPPPPPNQIIFAKLAKTIPVTDIYEAFWIEGTLKVETIKNDIAASAYTLDASKVSVWE